MWKTGVVFDGFAGQPAPRCVCAPSTRKEVRLCSKQVMRLTNSYEHTKLVMW